MKKLAIAGGLVLAIWGGVAQAVEFPVYGTGATGHAGDRVLVSLVYDYGASFGAIAEDLQFEYQFASMTFVPEASTIDVFGVPQNLLQYEVSLREFAELHGGSVVVNLDAPASLPDYKGYALSFYTGDGSPQTRAGLVTLHVAFDILGSALPGSSEVAFPNTNVLFDEGGTDFTYPAALQHLSVTVTAVPEPQIAWLLLAGLALLGGYARHRSKLSNPRDHAFKPAGSCPFPAGLRSELTGLELD